MDHRLMDALEKALAANLQQQHLIAALQAQAAYEDRVDGTLIAKVVTLGGEVLAPIERITRGKMILPDWYRPNAIFDPPVETPLPEEERAE